MPHDDKSLGDEATLQGANSMPADQRSLGDQSTFGGSEGSSLSDLGEFAGLPDHDIEMVDLSSRYKIKETLGKGGMGEVLLATDTRLDRKVAIKRIRGDAASSKSAVARFLAEAKSIAALSHNNVVQIYDYGRDQEGPFLIMEYVAGGSLLDRCKQGPIVVEEAIDLACQLCDGLGRAHDAGIIHRDIKPANILLTDDGVPKLTDFGLAKAESRDHTMTVAGAVLGTLDFMPPEQRQDASLVDTRSDLWSLAATLYQMVTGESPKVIRLNKVPVALQSLLDRALEVSKEDRYQTATELKGVLEQSLHGGADRVVALEQGSCPSCGTRNEATRKFCRNSSCAASLEVACLSCSAIIPVWESVCAECGSIQTDLLKQRREELTVQRTDAESFLAAYNFARAEELAREVANESDPRLQQNKVWSAEFIEQVGTVRLAELEKLQQVIAEALSHEQAHDYRSGIRSLEQIPAALLATSELPEARSAKDLLAGLQGKRDRVEKLEVDIKARIKAKQLSGLLAQVASLLVLLPDRADLEELKTKLQKRESELEVVRGKVLAAAKASMKKHDYAGALSAISKLKPELIDDELDGLRSLAATRETRCQELREQVQNAVASDSFDDRLAMSEEYLKLKPNDTEAQEMHAELVESVRKQKAEAAALAAQKRQEGNRRREDARAVAAKQRVQKLLITFAWLMTLAVVVLLPLFLYLRSRGKVRDVSEALSKGDYATAARLDPSNLDAFIQQALSEADFGAALQLDPTNEKALSMQKLVTTIQDSPPITNSIGMELKALPPGVFQIGDSNDSRRVSLTKAFLIGTHEVTQRQFARVMGKNPSYFQGSKFPVEQVTWDDAVEFCRKLSALPAEKEAGRSYRLPSEAEWEYACRAGTTSVFSHGDEESRLSEYAWHLGNSGGKTHDVGTMKPNPWGLYDMHGNVWEWCHDWHGKYPSGGMLDPRGPSSGSFRVNRGGGWHVPAMDCGSAYRRTDDPALRISRDFIGFRVAVSQSEN